MALVSTEVHGLWFNCSNDYNSFTGINDPGCQRIDFHAEFKLAPFIAGSMCVSTAVGLLALTLHLIAFIRLRLSDRIYSFHSAGELYLLAGLLFTLGLGIRMATQGSIYPVQDRHVDRKHSLLFGFYAAWLVPVLYFFTGVLLLADDIIHFLCTPKPKKRSLSLQVYRKLIPFTSTDIRVETINIREHRAADVKLMDESMALVATKLNPTAVR